MKSEWSKLKRSHEPKEDHEKLLPSFFFFHFYNNIYTFLRSISVKVSRKVERARVFFYFYNNIYTFSRSISVKVSRKVERARVFFFIFTITFTLLVGQFPLKFLGKSHVREIEDKLHHHHVMSMVCIQSVSTIPLH